VVDGEGGIFVVGGEFLALLDMRGYGMGWDGMGGREWCGTFVIFHSLPLSVPGPS